MKGAFAFSEKAIWKTRRKVLTPAFHFRILDEYVPIMNRRAALLCDKLAALGRDHFDVLPVMRIATFGILFGECSLVASRKHASTANTLTGHPSCLKRSVFPVVLREGPHAQPVRRVRLKRTLTDREAAPARTLSFFYSLASFP